MPRKEKTAKLESVVKTPVAPTATAEAPATATSDPQLPQLTLADIKNTIDVIDYAAAQGAFKGWETITQVLQVRQRLATFVEAATPKVSGEPITETATPEAANS